MRFALNLLRFEDIRAKVIEFLKNYTDAEFDYDAENIRFFIDAISYVSMLMNHQLAMQANELFIDTTTLRKNAVSIAKTLGYRPKRKIASRIYGKILYKGEGFKKDTSITIQPKNYFIGEDKGQTWTNIKPIKLEFYSPNILLGEFELIQGEWRKFTYFANGMPFQTFVIPDKNVDENYFELYVRRNDAPEDEKELWREVKTFNQLLEDKIYFVEEDIVNEFCPKIIFGNGIIGRIPSRYEIVEVEYLHTKGAEGNYETGIQFKNLEELDYVVSTDLINTFNPENLQIVIDPGTYSYGGYDNESIEEIKLYATRYFYSAGRAVSKEDYRVLLGKWKFIYDFNISGFEDIFPFDEKKAGYVYITAVPFLNLKDIKANRKFFLSDDEENEILAKLKEIGIISILKTFLKPSYIITQVYPKIEVDSKESQKRIIDIMQLAKEKVEEYFEKELCYLNKDFRISKICAVINEIDGVLSSDIHVDFYFGFHPDMFFRYKENVSTIPVIKIKDETGNFVLDPVTGKVLTKNWLKRNIDIVADLNKQEKYEFTVESLPPRFSSFFGFLSHPNATRIIFTRDVKRYDLAFFHEKNGITFYESRNFIDKHGRKKKPLVREMKPGIFEVSLDGFIFGYIYKTENGYEFHINPSTEEMQKDYGIDVSLNPYKIEKRIYNGKEVYVLTCKVISEEADIRLLEEKTFVIPKSEMDINDRIFYQGEYYDLSLSEDNGEITITFGDDNVLLIVDYENETVKYENHDVWNELGWRKNSTSVINGENEIIILIKGIFDDTSIGSLFYNTGIIFWNDKVNGVIKSNPEELDEFTIHEVFKYPQTQIDMIKLKPIEGENTKDYTDFDSQFNTFILPIIHGVTLK